MPRTKPAISAAKAADPELLQGHDWGLCLSLRRPGDERELTREMVADADLADHFEETWFTGFLQRGHLDVGPRDLTYAVLPIRQRGAEACNGFALAATGSRGRSARVVFTLWSLEPVAARASARLVEQEVLKPGDNYVYRVLPVRRARAAAATPAAAGTPATGRIRIRESRQLIGPMSIPLAPVLKDAIEVPVAEKHDVYPVVFTAQALADAERISRQGARRQPAVETGALLLGPLCLCPRTRRLFAVVCATLELWDAEQASYSLSPTGATWQRIGAILRAMQAQPGRAAWRILGTCHGHNFPPAEGLDCSVFVSRDDRTWSRTVFAGQPYHLCQIFGQDRSGKPAAALFGLRDGRLLERGYYVTGEFGHG